MAPRSCSVTAHHRFDLTIFSSDRRPMGLSINDVCNAEVGVGQKTGNTNRGVTEGDPHIWQMSFMYAPLAVVVAVWPCGRSPPRRRRRQRCCIHHSSSKKTPSESHFPKTTENSAGLTHLWLQFRAEKVGSQNIHSKICILWLVGASPQCWDTNILSGRTHLTVLSLQTTLRQSLTFELGSRAREILAAFSETPFSPADSS